MQVIGHLYTDHSAVIDDLAELGNDMQKFVLFWPAPGLTSEENESLSNKMERNYTLILNDVVDLLKTEADSLGMAPDKLVELSEVLKALVEVVELDKRTSRYGNLHTQIIGAHTLCRVVASKSARLARSSANGLLPAAVPIL